MIIGRSKSQQEIDTQIDRLADEFQKTESADGSHELERDGDRNPAGLGEVFPEEEKMGRPIPKVFGRG